MSETKKNENNWPKLKQGLPKQGPKSPDNVKSTSSTFGNLQPPKLKNNVSNNKLSEKLDKLIANSPTESTLSQLSTKKDLENVQNNVSVQNSKMQMLNNMLFSVASTNELLLIFVLAPKVNGKIKKPFYFSMVLSYLIAMLMVVLVIGVLGDTASLASYPVFEASELAKLGTNERLESIFIALWIFAIFLKTTLYLYCASQCFKGKKAGTKCVACGCVMLLAAWLILSGNAYDRLENIFVIIPYFVFAAVIPCGYLIFGKRKSGDDLIEAFKNN